ncbi:hypothetical protein EZV62_010525 [Acer yangbiense]|uniref:Auxin response factor n=1 Tax=Acer yangbiense TaxID=1000413 RepID=A0A5C7I2R4_9ROSI|nr:hypothetical protein EZV62_010525 [Acer yangbiense]
MSGVGGEGKSFVSYHQVTVVGDDDDQSRKRSSNFNDASLPTENIDPGGKDEAYRELWRACAGPHVYVPRNGDTVCYFIQGHLEQIEAYAKQDVKVEMPIYKLPYMVLCKVVSVSLKAETSSDETFAQIVLLPNTKQNEQSSSPLPPKTKLHSFSKKLTQSDTTTHGGFSVPKRLAEECLPQLDMSKDPPAQELIAKDLHGREWRFRHIFRGEDGELSVGVRRAMKQQINAPSIISGNSMQHGILGTASNAISMGTMFTVYYHPWSSPSEFIVPLDRYIKSTEIDYSVGTKIRMVYEGEDFVIKRIAGTVIGAKDVDQIRWPCSKWRSLQVKWDDISNTMMCPERVSPWNVELISTNKRLASVQHRKKRPCPDDASLPGSSSGVSQGQENGSTGVKELGPLKPSLFPFLVPQKNPDCGHDPHYLCPNGTVSSPSGSIVSSGLPNPNHWNATSTCAANGVRNNAVLSRNISVTNDDSLNSGSQECRSLELKNGNESPHSQPRGGSRKFMLFGVNLVSSLPELPSLQEASSNEFESLCSVPPMSQYSSISENFQVSEPFSSKSASGIPSGKQCKNCCLFRSCTKVVKYGTALRRSVDLTQFDGYEELVCKLDQMFDFNGSLIDGSSGWEITFTDDDGDMMRIGDYPWQVIQWAVRRMFICPKEDRDKLKMNASSPNPTVSD